MFIAKSITLALMLAVIGACSSSTAKKGAAQTDRAGATALPALGSFELEEDEIELEPKSAIALVSGKKSARSFIISITSSEVYNEDSFKSPSDYECLPCKGEDDPRCTAGEAEGSASLTLLFSGEALNAKTGLPSKKSYKLEGDPLKDLTTGVLVSFDPDDSDKKAGTPGIGKISFDAKPSLDEEMTVSLDLKFKKKSFVGDITTLTGTAPKLLKPDCDPDEEYVKFIFDE